jgi:phosphatidyl-myo-inositol dimannoside synthase
MRVLMLDNEFPPLGGGMGTVNQALLNCYARTPKLEIDLITSALGKHKEVEQFAANIRIIKLPVWNRNIHHSTIRELVLYAAQAVPQAVKLHRERAYDFCLAWSAVPAGAVARTLHRLVSLPYMVWVSGPDIPGFERRYHYIYPLLCPIIRSVWGNATHVVAKCAGEIEMIKSVDNRVDVSFIPNGVDLSLFVPGPEIPDIGPLHVLCVARLIERKGQNHLIEAVKQLSDSGVDVILSLIGDGDSKIDYEKQAHRLGILDRVRFVGYVPREEIASYYNAGHVFALPSFNEGMALAVLEAMAAGLPLIVTRTGGTIELVEHGVNGFVFDWADVESLTKWLCTLDKDRDLARRMAAASRARAVNYSWEHIAERFLDLFQNRNIR